jgi:hypothetical protein
MVILKSQLISPIPHLSTPWQYLKRRVVELRRFGWYGLGTLVAIDVVTLGSIYSALSSGVDVVRLLQALPLPTEYLEGKTMPTISESWVVFIYHHFCRMDRGKSCSEESRDVCCVLLVVQSSFPCSNCTLHCNHAAGVSYHHWTCEASRNREELHKEQVVAVVYHAITFSAPV